MTKLAGRPGGAAHALTQGQTRGVIRVMFRFYAELNDLLPEHRAQQTSVLELPLPTTVGDAIESLGVPHTEADVIVVNGDSVGFDRLLADGDRVAVYPVFEAIDVSPIVHLRPEPLRDVRFVADVHLGKLARLLRLCGFDCRYRNDFDDDELVDISLAERRVLLTKDRGLLKRRAVTHGCLVHNQDPFEQAVEIVRRLDLAGSIEPFTRCLACNGMLDDTDKEAVLSRLPPAVEQGHERFSRCRDCGRVYWPGSHHERLEAIVDRLRSYLG